jgi:hypothetical protein
MNNAESTEGRALSTEQIAAAGAGGEDRATPGQNPELDSEDRASSSQDPLLASPAGQPVSGQQAGPRSDRGTGDQPRAQLLEDDELQNIHVRWKDIQSEFVDEPRKAVQDADALVAELMRRLAQMFATERDQLESRWSGGEDVSTEDLRTGLRRYRSFFERLLAA